MKKVFNFQTKDPRNLFNDNLNAWAGIPCSRRDQITAQVHGAQSGPHLLNYIVLPNVTQVSGWSSCGLGHYKSDKN